MPASRWPYRAATKLSSGGATAAHIGVAQVEWWERILKTGELGPRLAHEKQIHCWLSRCFKAVIKGL